MFLVHRGSEASALIAKRAVIGPARRPCLDGNEVEENPLIGPNGFLEPHRVIDAGTPASRKSRIYLPET